MYLIAEIDSGGYIFAMEGSVMSRRMVHRETVKMHESIQPCFGMLKDAKVHLSDQSPYGNPMAILGLREDGGVSHIWVTDENRPLWEERLKQWRTCYGGWPVRRLNS